MADDDDLFKIPPIAIDIIGPHIKGADAHSVTPQESTFRRRTGGGGVLSFKGRETSVNINLTEEGLKQIVAALSNLRVDINRTMNEPATCQVYIGGVLAFDGQDKSALFSLDGKPKAPPEVIET